MCIELGSLKLKLEVIERDLSKPYLRARRLKFLRLGPGVRQCHQLPSLERSFDKVSDGLNRNVEFQFLKFRLK